MSLRRRDSSGLKRFVSSEIYKPEQLAKGLSWDRLHFHLQFDWIGQDMSEPITGISGKTLTDRSRTQNAMHLTSQEHEPYRKDDVQPGYINVNSNLPPVMKKRFPDVIAKRVSGLCSSEEKLNQHKVFTRKPSGEVDTTASHPTTRPAKDPRGGKEKDWGRCCGTNLL